MALMSRSKLKGKGPAHKSKSFKKKTNKQLAAKTITSKRKAKKRRSNVDVTMMDTDAPRRACLAPAPVPFLHDPTPRGHSATCARFSSIGMLAMLQR